MSKMHVALDLIGRNSAYSVTLIRKDTSLLIESFTITVDLKKVNEGYSRLWGSSNAKAHQCPEDKDPPINRCKCTHQAIKHSPQHTHLQTLYYQNKKQLYLSAYWFTKFVLQETKISSLCQAQWQLTVFLPYLSDIFPQRDELIIIPINTACIRKEKKWTGHFGAT